MAYNHVVNQPQPWRVAVSFFSTLRASVARANSYLCIGLDPDPARVPAHLRGQPDPIYAFCAELIAATADLSCAFKPNSAFFEACGASGMETLRRVIAAVPAGIPVILDAKRGDIGTTAAAYASAAFDYLGAHAITLNPYLGTDALAPFLQRTDRGCFILCKTSNPGSADLQDLLLTNGRPLYLEVAHRAQERWNQHGNLGLVVGATHPHELAAVRAACPTLPLLIPGVGAQGGDLEAAVRAGRAAAGGGVLLSVSRSIMYASSGRDFGAYARAAAQQLRDQMNSAILS
jgi:orotidine-5'-phosphate decarboxylase